jgi:hypothetical protein
MNFELKGVKMANKKAEDEEYLMDEEDKDKDNDFDDEEERREPEEDEYENF